MNLYIIWPRKRENTCIAKKRGEGGGADHAEIFVDLTVGQKKNAKIMPKDNKTRGNLAQLS